MWCIFYKFLYAYLIESYFKFQHTFSSILPYWHALEKTWSKQIPWIFFSKSKDSQFDCTDHYIEVRPFILNIGNDFFLGPLFSNKSIILWTRACVVFFVTSNRSIMTFFGCQSFCKKLNQSKYIICPFVHGKIKIGSCKINDILPMLEEHKAP